jgi:hypothetical protein
MSLDCLRYVPRATLNSCADRVDPNRRDGNAVLTGSASVSYR